MLGKGIAVLLGAWAVALSAWAASPLADFTGKSRVLVVAAPSSNDPSLSPQIQSIRAGSRGLRARDVVVVQVIGTSAEGPFHSTQDAQRLRAFLKLRSSKFGVALVGKDGFEAFHQARPITMASLFQIIDAMPMRQQEIRVRRPRGAPPLLVL